MLSRLKGPAVLRAYRFGETVSRRAPKAVADRALAATARVAAARGGDKRVVIERNMERIHGRKLTRNELDLKVRATYESYARYYYDSFRLPALSVEQVRDGLTVEGLEHIIDALDNDEVGPILALPHLGGWEWAAFWISAVQGWKIAAVAERLEPPELFDWFLKFRTSIGLNIIPLGPTAADDVVAAMLNKEIVCLLCDRDLVGSGPQVEFFGETTSLPAGPAVMSLKGGARVLPVGVYFTEYGVHAVVRPPVEIERDPDATSMRADVQRFTQKLAGELEHLIRLAPEQWHLLQPNWPSDFEVLGKTPSRQG